MTATLTLSNLSCTLGGHRVLDGVSLVVPRGCCLGLIGPNGSGKSTLLRHLYRALVAPPGTIALDGRDLTSLTQRELATRVAVLRQDNVSDFDFSVLEMTLLGRSPYLKPYQGFSQKDVTLAQNSLAYVGLSALANRRFSTLSGGERQRAYIARALTQEADVLLLDEPTNHLDIHYKIMLMTLVRSLKRTVVCALHELDLAYRFCDQVVVLAQGRKVAHGAPHEALTMRCLRQVFGVESAVVTSDGEAHLVVKSVCAEPSPVLIPTDDTKTSVTPSRAYTV